VPVQRTKDFFFEDKIRTTILHWTWKYIEILLESPREYVNRLGYASMFRPELNVWAQ